MSRLILYTAEAFLTPCTYRNHKNQYIAGTLARMQSIKCQQIAVYGCGIQYYY